MKVAVIGAAGYVGGELLRLLLQHPEVTECVATSRSQAGKPIADVHPALATLSDARFSGQSAGEVARGRDVVFLCLEHGESSRVAGEVFEAGPGLVVDLAADFRVRDLGLYERYYGVHPAPELVPRFVYGLADVLGAAAPWSQRPSRRPDVSPPPRSSPSIRCPAYRWSRRPRSSPSPGRAAPGCSPGPRPTTRCGPTTCSPTRCWATATRPRCCSAGGNGWAGPTPRRG